MELKAAYWHYHLDVRIFRSLCTDGDGNCIVAQFIGTIYRTMDGPNAAG